MAAEEALSGVLYGIHPVEEALRSGARPVRAVHLAASGGPRLRLIEALARERGLPVRRADARALDRLAGGGAHQGVVAMIDARPVADLEDFLGRIAGRPECAVVVLDEVQDPHNLGAVIRNCALTGAAAVVLPKDRTVGLTPAAEKVAAGGLEHVEVVRAGNLAAGLRRLKEEGFWVVGADADGPEDLERVEFAPRTALVMGAEHRGLRRLTREHCDMLVRIPSTGKLDSFNVGVASGIILHRLFLQRRNKVLTSTAGKL